MEREMQLSFKWNEEVGNDEANVSTQDPTTRARARFPGAHGNRRWTSGAQTQAPARTL